MNRPPGGYRHHRMRGFTLVEIVVVLIIVSVLVAMAAAMSRGVVAAQQRSLTNTRIAGLDAALAQYVATQKRLPCPADGTVAPGDTSLGTEVNRNSGGCTGNQQNGIVPFRALGLTEIDGMDGWGRRMTYRIDPLLAADNAMDMSNCDPAGTANALGAPTYLCATGCVAGNVATCTPPLKFLNKNGAGGKGLEVRASDGVTKLMDPAASPPTGAAYVIVSAGETGGGAYLPSGNLGASTVTDGTQEQRNYADKVLQAYYVDDNLSSASGAAHFDDVVSHPSLFAVLSRAGLGPRVHN